ncbi:MAG: hypothetical protein JJU05_16680 [Verrucomicrobia bacterium]|nr:hypothetical protein [Verrucomicrobiota bacterium]
MDFENVQPSDLNNPAQVPVKVMVFVGEHQQKISLELAASLQKLGEKAEYIRMTGRGQNALDFHIAFWIGKISVQDPQSYFHIVSKDKGFDPLIAHLKSQKILAHRIEQLSDIRILSATPKMSHSERVSAITAFLQSRGNARPRRRQTLRNSISSYFSNTLEEAELDKIIQTMLSKKLISIKDEVVTYSLPEDVLNTPLDAKS